jgi:hypothetical protein
MLGERGQADMILGVRRVAGKETGPAVRRFDRRHGLFGAVAIVIGDNDVGAFLREQHGDGAPDSRARRSDDRGLALQDRRAVFICANGLKREIPVCHASNPQREIGRGWQMS